jgi:hypothetical protein
MSARFTHARVQFVGLVELVYGVAHTDRNRRVKGVLRGRAGAGPAE